VPLAVVIGQWEKLFMPSTPFLMTPSSGAMIDDRLERRAIDNNKAPLPPTNDSARGESTDSLLLMFRLLKKQDYDITGLSSQSQIIWEIQSHLIWNLTLHESLFGSNHRRNCRDDEAIKTR
jgi:hypothetical protein